jgi:putative effector of murein hydrolase
VYVIHMFSTHLLVSPLFICFFYSFTHIDYIGYQKTKAKKWNI